MTTAPADDGVRHKHNSLRLLYLLARTKIANILQRMYNGAWDLLHSEGPNQFHREAHACKHCLVEIIPLLTVSTCYCFALDGGAKYCDKRVSMSVCLLAYLKDHMS